MRDRSYADKDINLPIGCTGDSMDPQEEKTGARGGAMKNIELLPSQFMEYYQPQSSLTFSWLTPVRTERVRQVR